jgi:hypothetical protein
VGRHYTPTQVAKDATNQVVVCVDKLVRSGHADHLNWKFQKIAHARVNHFDMNRRVKVAYVPGLDINRRQHL